MIYKKTFTSLMSYESSLILYLLLKIQRGLIELIQSSSDYSDLNLESVHMNPRVGKFDLRAFPVNEACMSLTLGNKPVTKMMCSQHYEFYVTISIVGISISTVQAATRSALQKLYVCRNALKYSLISTNLKKCCQKN